MELLSDFNFEIVYVLGTENVLTDALSWLYSNEPSRTVCAPSEYLQHDKDHLAINPADAEITMPVYTGLEANTMMTTCMGSGAKPKWTLKPKIQANKLSTVFAKQMASKKFMLHSPKASSEAGDDEGPPSWNNGPDLEQGDILLWNSQDDLYMEGEPIPSLSILNINEDRV